MTATAGRPVSREVVLVGGGHTHALIVRHLARHPWPGTRVTLVSDVPHAPYSGMIPGHLAGIYTWKETHIDLRPLCDRAGVRFLVARASGLDPAAGRLLLDGQPPLSFDTASLNIGSTPAVHDVPGAAEYAMPAKPVARFLEAWEHLRSRAASDTRAVRALVVGAGAGGVEVALAMKARLGPTLDLTLVQQGPSILPTHAAGVRRRLLAALHREGVTLITGQPVTAVRPDGVLLRDGQHLPADTVFWTTQASAPPWVRSSGLAVDAAGFIAVDDTLRSLSHPHIFAAGDCATVTGAVRPKSGVFAVRAAQPLFHNLGRHLAGIPGQPWHPQKQFLALISTGRGRAVASRGRWTAEGTWVWRWKDHIDRAFMRQFTNDPPHLPLAD
jgi:selenide,water dikinase